MLRRLAVAAGVLAAVGGAAYWANKQPVKEDKKEGADTVAPKLVDLRGEDIQRVDLKRRDAEETTLERSGKEWRIVAPKALKADQDAASTLAVSFAPLSAERMVEEKASDLQQYGLTTPAIDVTVTGKGGKTQEVLIGDNTPTNSGFFAKLANDPRVFILSSFTKTSLDKVAKDLQDKRLLTFDPEKLSRVELAVKGQNIEFGKNAQSDWQILKPKPMRADGSQVEGLVQKLKDARMDQVPSDEDLKKAAAAFATATPVAIAKVTDAAGTQQMDVRKKGDEYYARTSAVEGVYKIAKDVGTAFDKNPDDFRNRKVLDLGFNDPDRVEVKNGDKTYSFTKAADKWISVGKTMDTVSVQNLIDKVRDLSALKYPETGFVSPTIEITVVSGGGKKTEKVQVAQAGPRYIAKRENEPTLYELDPKSVPDLLQAAADVKESKPDPKAAKK